MTDEPVPAEKPGRRGFFAKVRRGLFMTHTEILEKLEGAVKKGLGIDESVLETLEEALLSADVGAETAAALTDAVRARAGSSERTDLAALRAILVEEVEKLLTSAPREGGRPDVPLFVTFLVGVNGSGKTTTTAKLAAREKAAGRSVLLAAADTFRAGAIEQLQTWADRLELPLVRHKEGADPSAVLFDALSSARARGIQSLLVDTAGRLHTRKNLMEELSKMRRIASAAGKSRWLTGERARRRALALREEYDAVLVGAGTVIADDPRLTRRLGWNRAAPHWRIVLDGRLRTPEDARVFRGPGRALVVTAVSARHPKARRLASRGVVVWSLPSRTRGRVDLRRLLRELARRDVASLIVEGGAETLGSFFSAGLVDRVAVFLAPRILGGARAPAAVGGLGFALGRTPRLDQIRIGTVGDDLLVTGRVT